METTESQLSKEHYVAVLTSDIVHSTHLSPDEYKAVIASLTVILTRVAKENDAVFEIFRGDGFQMYFKRIDVAIKCTLVVRLYMQAGIECKSVLLTQSLAIDMFDDLTDKPGTSSGKAFLISGRQLDNAKRGDLIITLPSALSAPGLILSTKFLQQLLSGLTTKQANVLYHYVDQSYPEQKVIAKALDMTRQNVATHLKRGGADLISEYINTFASILQGSQK
ncbi:sigma-70 family RNA polymerase sigma factor [Glaciecola sp. MH2013]|uniref:sigma-70 family RNA polymerase sigma factor n=1 Tax=Glaciecola sp. MH2013 TaxID=2785524 RepID=UPI00189FC615|nr:sigma-70 family RNA polymerase sigma factor [Glaciecola sp. MH2013]MBF7072812.1 sigma-70 family RNA polymerase sigma factor [Glaciecola sp. MH2013]